MMSGACEFARCVYYRIISRRPTRGMCGATDQCVTIPIRNPISVDSAVCAGPGLRRKGLPGHEGVERERKGAEQPTTLGRQ